MIRVVLVTILLAGCAKTDPREHAPRVKVALDSTPSWVDRGDLGKKLWKAERDFYAVRQNVPAWFEGERLTKGGDELLQVLRGAAGHGLDPARYGTEELATAVKKVAKEQVADLDLRLTYAYLQQATDLLGGTSSPKQIDENWVAAKKDVDLVKQLAAAVESDGVKAALDGLAPSHAQYRGLQAALEAARAKGDRAAEERIAMNLERWRWAPRDLGKKHILVNVPGYAMQVVEDDKPVLAMKVIVGKPDAPTPLFSDEMSHVVFSPFWNIPEQILREETLPKLAEDPDYLARNGIEAVNAKGEPVDPSSFDWGDDEETKAVRFRQIPGPDNALGQVKFIFPNHFNVYLHDTPEDKLFLQEKRALSHGCMRVEKPLDLARYVLSGSDKWTDAKIIEAMNAGKEEWTSLKEKLPVHIGYFTAWVQEDGNVVFTDDPYGIDARHVAARQGTPAQRSEPAVVPAKARR